VAIDSANLRRQQGSQTDHVGLLQTPGRVREMVLRLLDQKVVDHGIVTKAGDNTIAWT
jgi:hypothetical protein